MTIRILHRSEDSLLSLSSSVERMLSRGGRKREDPENKVGSIVVLRFDQLAT